MSLVFLTFSKTNVDVLVSGFWSWNFGVGIIIFTVLIVFWISHFTVLEPNFMMGSFGLSEKERKKREKEEEKERIKMMKEEKKLEKKRIKEEEKLKKELEKEKRRDSRQKKQQQQLKAILGESFEVDTQTSVNQKNNNKDNQVEDNQVEDDQIEEEPLP